jgi:hypothetical protein
MSKHTVTLVMEVEAEDSGDAARAFVDHLVDKGMRGWRYQVFDNETGSEAVYNGWGDLAGYVTPSDTPETLTDSDADLLAAAERLNNES